MTHKTTLSFFCRNLHVLRLRHGLSLMEMAALLQLPPAELAAIESGTVPRSVTVDVLFHILTHFGIRPGQMLSDDFGQ